MSLSHSPKIPTNGLLLCLDAANPRSYPGSGTIWYDLSGNGRNATIVGSPVFSNTYFDSTGDTNYFSAPSISHRTDDFTYSMWMTIDTVDSLSTLFEDGSWGDTLLFRHQTNSILVYAESVYYGSFPFLPIAEQWYNIVFKRQSSVGYCYINNIQAGTSIALSVDINLGNQNLFLMRSQHTTGQNNDGKISVFSVYNRALTDAEITQNYNALRWRYGI